MAGEAHRRRLRALARRCGVAVEPEAIETAFVHESAVREGLAATSNERLEWLGDPILGFVVARWLYARYPNAAEGELARRKNALVSRETLALTARRLEFGAMLHLGAGERAAGGADRTSILGNAFEAFIGAVYLASGLDAVAGMIEREHLLVVERPEMADPDAKTELQERIQAQRLATPHYEEDASGPPHSRTFTSRVYVGERCIGEGTGPSKKLAQQAAATAALAAAALATAQAEPQPRAAHAESTAAVPGPHGESNAKHDAGGPESLGAPRPRRGGRGARGAAPFNPSAP